MSSSGGIKGRGINHHSKNNDLPQRTFCQNLFYFLPCFKKHVSPASSSSSSKNSKSSIFLENHYVIKCPKKKADKNKKDEKKNMMNKDENVSAVYEHNGTPIVNLERISDHKEVRFLGASKKNCERDNYRKLLGMEPNDYLNQFSSVFIKNLKTPVPKDPSALPKKFNVYVPPKQCNKKINRSMASLGRITDVRNVLQYRKQGHIYPVNQSLSTIVRKKCRPLLKNISQKTNEDGQSNIFGGQITPGCSESNTHLNKGKDTHLDSSSKDSVPPWQCSDSLPFHKFFDLPKKQEFKSKHILFGEQPEGKKKIKSKSNVKKLKKYLCISNDSNKEDRTKHNFYNEAVERSVLCNKTLYRTKEISSESDGSDEEQVVRAPWPKQNFLQLQAHISNNAFRKVIEEKTVKSQKTLIWKLIIKNQKE